VGIEWQAIHGVADFISGIAVFAAGAVLRSFVAGARATVFWLGLECFHLKSPLALSY
jgi:hypothetical protein